MSRRKHRRPSRSRTSRLGKVTAKCVNITIAEGESKGMYFTLYGLDEEDVESARRACADGCPNEAAFLIVYGLFEVLGLDSTGWCGWPKDDVLDLFAMVGLPVSVWPGDMDADLARLLSGAAS